MGARPVPLVGMPPRSRRPRTWTAREFVPSPQLATDAPASANTQAGPHGSQIVAFHHMHQVVNAVVGLPRRRANHSVSLPINTEGVARRRSLFDFNNGRPRQMAGFARCSRCNHALTSVHVEAVPALGALPAASKVLVVGCSNCRAPLGTSIVGLARTDARNRFHGASVAMTHPGRRQSVGETVRRLLEDEGR
jgi:hypothetical protein